jgi:hypothetical protein
MAGVILTPREILGRKRGKGPIYEGDDGQFLTLSRTLTETVVPGTQQPLFPADVERAALQRSVRDDFIFTVRGRAPIRSRKDSFGTKETVLGYKFNDSTIVVYRGAGWDLLSTSVDVDALATNMEKSGDFSEDELYALTEITRTAPNQRLTFPSLVLPIASHTPLELTRAQKSEVYGGPSPGLARVKAYMGSPGLTDSSLTVIKALIRRVSLQVLKGQNVDTSEFMTGAEEIQSSVDALFDDMRGFELDF